MTLPIMHLYRQPEIRTLRPCGFDVAAEGWLWQGQRSDRLFRHNVHTAAAETVALPLVRGSTILDVKVCSSLLVIAVEDSLEYVIFDPATSLTWTRPISDNSTGISQMRKLPDGRLALFERQSGRLLLLEDPLSEPRIIECPWKSRLVAGKSLSDGLVYIAAANPARLIRFDPKSNRFLDEIPCPRSDTAITDGLEHAGVVYFVEPSRGRLHPFTLAGRCWGEAIPLPDLNDAVCHVSACAEFKGRLYYSLTETPSHPAGLQLVFDPAEQRFDTLAAPEQPDGIPILCRNWSDGERLYITGYVAPFSKPGEPSEHPGDWMIFQSHPAESEPGFARYDFEFDKKAHMDATRRCAKLSDSLYIPNPLHSPAIANIEGSAAPYPVGVEQRLKRRAKRTDEQAYLQGILDRILQPHFTAADRTTAILDFVNTATYYNPLRELSRSEDTPVAMLAGHDIRCGGAATVMIRLLEPAGVECRRVGLHHHVVAEARFDSAWHLCDALFFGSSPPRRDGHWLSVEDLKADPYFADACPLDVFVFPDECMRSRDDYYVLGYNMGIWGAEPYYSYYLGAPFDCPPTLPHMLPVRRMDGGRVTIRWAESLKRGGGRIEYDVGIYADRRQNTPLFTTLTDATSLVWQPPENNRMYFIGVRAMDEHRRHNPDTWYPTARGNFVPAPSDQYGWYGVI